MVDVEKYKCVSSESSAIHDSPEVGGLPMIVFTMLLVASTLVIRRIFDEDPVPSTTYVPLFGPVCTTVDAPTTFNFPAAPMPSAWVFVGLDENAVETW